MDQKIGWWAVRVTGGWEFSTSDRISNAGFESYCPQFIERQRRWTSSGYIFSQVKTPLLRNYIFVRCDAAFRKDKFDTSKVTLSVLRKKMVTDEELTLVNEVALAQSLSAAKGERPKFEPGQILELQRAVLNETRLRVLEVGKKMVEVQRLSGGLPFKVKVEELGKAV